jgi:F-type H+-transporting ATPase subunit gamma
MPTLREVRQRIAGVKRTQKITKAMKMVAAAKLRRAQTGIISARPYARSMKALLDRLVSGPDVEGSTLIRPRPVQHVGVVVVTADRGLCGAFNSNLIRAAMHHCSTAYPNLAAEGKVKLFCVGRKGIDFFNKQRYPVVGRHPGVFGHLSFGEAQKISHEVVESYERGDVDRVDIIYNEFKSTTQARVAIEQYLPLLRIVETAEKEPEPGPPSVDYIYEPDLPAIVTALIPRHMHFQFWRVLLESNAAEQGARMAAMENATENANEMIDTLQLQYNKARQAAITKELLEVVSGAEALQGR